MNFDELVEEVERYGCSQTIEPKQTLIYAANRALSDLHYYLPITKSLRFYARGFKPIIHYKEILYNGANPIFINTRGKCYTMQLMGKGHYTIMDGDTAKVFQFDTGNETQRICGFITHGGYIKFWGGFSYTVYNFAIYDDVLSPMPEDIPDGSGRIIYDMRKICPDFLSFISPPTDADGNVIENCRYFDGKIELDSDFSGELNIKYRRLPTKIVGIEKVGDEEEVIDVCREYIPMLIYLIWYHYLSNSDDDRAKLYKSRFDNLLALYKENNNTYDKTYIDVNGWA